MKTLKIFTMCVVFSLTGLYAQEAETNTANRIFGGGIVTSKTDLGSWEIDKRKTAFEAIKLGVMYAIPISLFVGSAFGVDSYKPMFITAAAVFSIPPIFGTTLLVVDVVRYKKQNEEESVVSLSLKKTW